MNSASVTGQSLVLETAWRSYAELDFNAKVSSNRHLWLRGSIIALVVLATLMAILADIAERPPPDSFLQVLSPAARQLQMLLILAPVIGSVLLAFANRVQRGDRWLALRAAAEEILKEIYLYRTLLQRRDDRRHWLDQRIAEIKVQLSEATGGELVLIPYKGPIPPYYDPKYGNDPGFGDLLAEDYIRYRLEDQLNWHSRRLPQVERQRLLLQVGIFAFGGLGTFLAAIGGSLLVWVAFTSAVVGSLTAFLELRRLDAVVRNYSKVILGLGIIRDRWRSLTREEMTGDEFFRMVDATEKVLWTQHTEFITELRQAVQDAKGGKDQDPVDQAMNTPAPPDIDEALLSSLIRQPSEAVADRLTDGLDETDSAETRAEAAGGAERGAKPEIVAPPGPARTGEAAAPEAPTDPARSNGAALPAIRERAAVSANGAAGAFGAGSHCPHAFVVMPFGRKQGPDGGWIDFDSIYRQLIQPALLAAGFEPFRADEESVSGDILTDMFQELLLADLVVADISIDNANVFYELGVRHAMRKRGVMHIQSGRAYMPFDVFNVRTVPYHCDSAGKPDPKYRENDTHTLATSARETWESEGERVHSPIFNLLTGLSESDRKSLETPLARGYWREYHNFKDRVAVAQRAKRPGDVLLLTEEVSNPLIYEEAIGEAGRVLKNLGQHELALRQYRRGLELNEKNPEFRREEALHLARLGRYDEAIVRLEGLLKDDPTDAEAVSYLGRIYKVLWQGEWENVADDQERLQQAYDAAHWLKKSIETYLKGFQFDPNHYYSGINALALSAVLDHLTEKVGAYNDPETEAIRQRLPYLTGTVRFALENAAENQGNDYWLLATQGDFSVISAQDPRLVTISYKKALTLAGANTFALQSTLAQLELLGLLAFRPEYVDAGIAVFQEALARRHNGLAGEAGPEEAEPSQVLLFSGHMIDGPDRTVARFPSEMEEEAREKIERALDRLNAGPQDLAITAGAACGGDILFIERCLGRNMKVEVFLPFDEAAFIEQSVRFAGDGWVRRFYNLCNNAKVTVNRQLDRVGPAPNGGDAFDRNNRWALYSAAVHGIDRMRALVLWDGRVSGRRGGVDHLVREVHSLGGMVEHLDTTKFDFWKAG